MKKIIKKLIFPADQTMIDALETMRDMHKTTTETCNDKDEDMELPLSCYAAAAAVVGIAAIGVMASEHGAREANEMINKALLELEIIHR